MARTANPAPQLEKQARKVESAKGRHQSALKRIETLQSKRDAAAGKVAKLEAELVSARDLAVLAQGEVDLEQQHHDHLAAYYAGKAQPGAVQAEGYVEPEPGQEPSPAV
jgi:chromosome segregation ATPase